MTAGSLPRPDNVGAASPRAIDEPDVPIPSRPGPGGAPALTPIEQAGPNSRVRGDRDTTAHCLALADGVAEALRALNDLR